MRLSVVALAAAASLTLCPPASAFCGFYVSGADAKLYNNATQVALVREGTRTVLSMANNYQGPPEDFAMVVPVPVVLQKENVKTLPHTIFDRLDQLTAPRLVEYWEQDPCPQPSGLFGYGMAAGAAPPATKMAGAPRPDEKRPAVRIEAQFTVGEYEVVILSADDALSLDTWLRKEKYRIPEGAEPYLRPYVMGGMKFFVARVDPKKVTFKDGMAQLSPLRFFYDSELFSLPIRLGLINSSGTQDLIVYLLARSRYEVANYTNVTIPTNLNVKSSIKGQFGSFYGTLFDLTVSKHPGAVVTEYAWQATKCDPCPTSPLEAAESASLGMDVLPLKNPSQLVITRLHARYKKESLGEDLVFKEAPPIVGGREVYDEKTNQLESLAKPDAMNNFQARYAIRHLWSGPIKCANPQRGVWGGPPGGDDPSPQPASNIAFAPRMKVEMGSLVWAGKLESKVLSQARPVKSTIPLGIVPASPSASAPASAEPPPLAPDPPPPAPSAAPPAPPASPPRGGCAGCQATPTTTALPALLALAGLALRRLRRGRDGKTRSR